MLFENKKLETEEELFKWTKDEVSTAEPSSEENKHVRWKLDAVVVPFMMVIVLRMCTELFFSPQFK
jgi:hypothetical protein